MPLTSKKLTNNREINKLWNAFKKEEEKLEEARAKFNKKKIRKSNIVLSILKKKIKKEIDKHIIMQPNIKKNSKLKRNSGEPNK